MALSARLAANQRSSIPLTFAQLGARDRVASRLASGEYEQRSTACFCGAEGGLLIAERDRYGLPVRTVLCPRCGLLRSDPRLTDAAAATFYQQEYRTLYGDSGGAEALLAEQIRRGRAYLNALAPLLGDVETIFEVGCGAGGLLLPFAEAGKRVVGCDLGADYLEAGRARGLELVHGDVGALLEYTQGRRADLLFLIHVVEHFSDLRSAFEEVSRVLAPGGLLFVDVPGLRNIKGHEGYRGDLLRYLQNAHNHHFSGRTLSFVLQSLGFEVLSCDEKAGALARKRTRSSVRSPLMPAGEPRALLRLLADLEREQLTRTRRFDDPPRVNL